MKSFTKAPRERPRAEDYVSLVVGLFFFLTNSNGSSKVVSAWTGSPLSSVRKSNSNFIFNFNSRLSLSPFRQPSSSYTKTNAKAPQVSSEDNGMPKYGRAREFDEMGSFDLTGGRPGAIVETEEQLAIKEQMEKEIEGGARRHYDKNVLNDYGTLQEDEEAEFDIDDPTAIDASTLGFYTIKDLQSKFDYEWDPLSGDPDPNAEELVQEGVRYVEETEKDDDGVEVGYDPIFGPSNPLDTRAIKGAADSYMIDENTKDDSMLTPQFHPGDPEIGFNEDVVQFRKSLDIMETYIDPFLPDDMEIPRHTAKWHGYPEPVFFDPKPFENNRFTKPEDKTDFTKLTPFQARQKAVELARAKNAEWLPDGVSQTWHAEQRQPYEAYGTDVGTLRQGHIDAATVEQAQPALEILGSCVDLLSCHRVEEDNDESGVVFRFHYHGLMKNKHGMRAWAESLLADCGVDVTGVVFETGFRRRDPAYDGGDPYYGPHQ